VSVEGMRALALALRHCAPEWPGRQPPPKRMMVRQVEPEGDRQCDTCGHWLGPERFHVTGIDHGGRRYRRRTCKECRNKARRVMR